MLESNIRIANRVNSLDVSVVRVDINNTIIIIGILIKIFFCYSLISKDLVISLLFFYKSSAFICFLERLEDYCFILDKIYTILLYLNSFLDSGDNISNLLLLLSLLLYFLFTLIVLLIIIIFAVFEIFSFFEKALA